MFPFSAPSRAQLATCDERLQRVLLRASQFYNFTVVEGHRGEELQTRAYLQGKSKLPWPKGNHNKRPSRAADVAPYPVDWREGELPHARFAMLGGVLLVSAAIEGVKIRLGFDWNRNLDPRDETFLDWGHVELDEP